MPAEKINPVFSAALALLAAGIWWQFRTEPGFGKSAWMEQAGLLLPSALALANALGFWIALTFWHRDRNLFCLPLVLFHAVSLLGVLIWWGLYYYLNHYFRM